MGMKYYEKSIGYFYGEYKRGVLAKKELVTVFVYPEYIEGVGYRYNDDIVDSKQDNFNISLAGIKNIEIIKIGNIQALKIDYTRINAIVNNKDVHRIIVPGLKEPSSAMEVIESVQKDYLKNKMILDEIKKQEIIREQELEKEEIIREQELAKVKKKFYEDCYNFHIANEDNPCFEVYRDELQLAAIYIDGDKNINFVRIDGDQQEENNAMIDFSKVHYYEKAGSIHYTSEINGQCSSFGGSLTGGRFSKAATLCGGLLFGPMGMAVGALFTHKPAQITMPETTFNIQSNIKEVDDRSVILNYYSDVHKQYIDIELPADIYNFLQTHLPTKKYEIVMEIEKKLVLEQAQIGNRELSTTPQVISQNQCSEKEKGTEDLEEFKEKMKKLKIMHECAIITDEEFETEKNKLLASI